MKIASKPAIRSGVFEALAFLLILLPIYVLPPPLPIRSDIDASWQLALTTAFLKGAQFGRDLVFTYGPWGFVTISRGDTSIYPWLIAARLLLACALVFGSARFAATQLDGWQRTAWMALVILVADPMTVVPMLLLALRTLRKPTSGKADQIITALLVVACGLVTWTKFTVFVLVAALCVVLLTQDLMRRRRPFVPAGILLSAMFFWLLAGQSLSGLPSYFRGALSIAQSYSGAMGTPGEKWVLVIGTLLCILVIGVAGLSLLEAGRLDLPAFAWIGAYEFVIFKQGFIRQDWAHLLTGMMGGLLPGALVVLAASVRPEQDSDRQSGIRMRRAITRAGWAVVLVLYAVFSIYTLSTPARRWFAEEIAPNMAAGFLRPTPSLRSAAAERDLEEVRRLEPIGPIRGTADFFPDNLAVLAANRVPMRLRPVLQSYTAYNEFLTGMNASFLRGPTRPDNVVFDVAPIDERYPSIADSLSVLALLSCYQPAGFTGRYLLLSAAGCLDVTRSPLLDTTAEPGKLLMVPQSESGPIWAEVDVKWSALEDLLNLALRRPRLQLAVSTDRQYGVYSMPRDLAKAGFLLSPLLHNPVSFGLLYTQPDVDSQIRGFAIDWVDGIGRSLFRRPLNVRLYALNVPRRGDTASVSPLLVQLAHTVRAEAGLASQPAVPEWFISAGQPRVRVNASSAGTVDMSVGARAVNVGYGLKNLCGEPEEPFARVRFSVLWYSGSAKPTTLLDRIAEARGSTEFSDEVTVMIPPAAGQLAFRTEPLGGTCFTGAWWSGLHTHEQPVSSLR
jgi:hypothetical protein